MQTEVLLVDLSFLHPVWAIGLPIAGSLPLGWWMARVLNPPPERIGKGLDAGPVALLRLLGRREPAKMYWKQYAFALLAFNVALFVLSFAILLAQGHLPVLNPDGKGPLDALGYKDTAGMEHARADTAVIFNTVCSFVTNTNLQHYSGEQHLSYFSQLGAVVWLQFVTPACGLAVMLAVIRGLRGERELGDFYLDTIRGLLLVLVPLSIIVAVLLVATGVPMTLRGAAAASTVEVNGTGAAWRPICSRSTTSSTVPSPSPPSGSGTATPAQPWSSMACHSVVSHPPPASTTARTWVLDDRSSSRSRAPSRSAS